jgi:hypothetical protein
MLDMGLKYLDNAPVEAVDDRFAPVKDTGQPHTVCGRSCIFELPVGTYLRKG